MSGVDPGEFNTGAAIGSPIPLQHHRACTGQLRATIAGLLSIDSGTITATNGLTTTSLGCVCGLAWRIRLATEQEYSATLRQRAEEAEAALAATIRGGE